MPGAARLVSDDFEVTKAVLPLLRFTRNDTSSDPANVQTLTGTLTINYAGFDRDGVGHVFARTYLINVHAGSCITTVALEQVSDTSTPRWATLTLARLSEHESEGPTIGQRLVIPGAARAAVNVERIAFDYMASSAKPGSALSVGLLQGCPR